MYDVHVFDAGVQGEEGLSRTNKGLPTNKNLKAPTKNKFESTPRVTHGPQRTRVTHGAERAQTFDGKMYCPET